MTPLPKDTVTLDEARRLLNISMSYANYMKVSGRSPQAPVQTFAERAKGWLNVEGAMLPYAECCAVNHFAAFLDASAPAGTPEPDAWIVVDKRGIPVGAFNTDGPVSSLASFTVVPLYRRSPVVTAAPDIPLHPTSDDFDFERTLTGDMQDNHSRNVAAGVPTKSCRGESCRALRGTIATTPPLVPSAVPVEPSEAKS